jgi:DNA-binding PadR family transcriptional regulator
MDNLLPIKFRILHYLSTVETACADDFLIALKDEYGREKYFKRSVITEHLMDMKANFIIDDDEVLLDDAGQLVIYYKINDEGRKLLKKYLPKSWKNA